MGRPSGSNVRMRRDMGLLWDLEAVGFDDPQHHETKGGAGNADAGSAREVERKAAITNQMAGGMATKTDVCFGEGPNTNHETTAQELMGRSAWRVRPHNVRSDGATHRSHSYI